MFVGETGIGRIIERTCQLMKDEHAGESADVTRVGGIDLEMLQRHINLWFSLSLDLHGNEISTNAAAYFANGLKGRAEEAKWEDHRVDDSTYTLDVVEDGQVVEREVPMRNAMNEVLRDWYEEDCQAGVNRWNKILERHGMTFRFRLPDRKFNRGIGQFAGHHFDPDGRMLKKEDWERLKYQWLPGPKDKEYLLSIMNRSIFEPGKFANYIAAPARGIKGMPINFEYVRTEA